MHRRFFHLTGLCLFALVILLLTANVHCQVAQSPVDFLYCEFKRVEIGEDSKSSSAIGRIFFSAPDKVWVLVTWPVKQTISIKRNTMLVYYPDEKSAYHISSNNPITMLIVTPFIAALRLDYGLSDLKYYMENYRIIEDTLEAEWQPHTIAKGFIGKVVIKSVDDKILEVKKYDAATEKAKSKIVFSDHALQNDIFWLPAKASFYDLTKQTPQLYEEITLSNPQINISIPDSIKSFRLPENITVKEYQW